MSLNQPSILILGTRGVPASHGGFETFAEQLALFLVERGWRVSVYCQQDVDEVKERVSTSEWRGVELINVQVASRGPRATLEFDWHCIRDAAKRQGVCLVLGYNSAVFLPWLRLFGRSILTNMDGIEWKRPKWSLPVRAWFWVNEWVGAWASHRLIADHPSIADHLATRRSASVTAVIPYGGVAVNDASQESLAKLGLESDRYLISIARIEPDNNIEKMVRVFSSKPRGVKLVVLGTLDPERAYHREVRAAAGDDVIFPGAIYDPAVVQALRFHARTYMHGHTVGGTNPSLVEALWAGNAVIAHDNVYNRWTAGDAAVYFSDEASLSSAIDHMTSDNAAVAGHRSAARARAEDTFKWNDILAAYEDEALALLKGEVKRTQTRWAVSPGKAE